VRGLSVLGNSEEIQSVSNNLLIGKLLVLSKSVTEHNYEENLPRPFSFYEEGYGICRRL